MVAVATDVRQATPLVEPRVGFLAWAKQIQMPGVRWGRGVQWLAEMQPTASEGYGARALKCTMVDPGHQSDDRSFVESASPFQAFAFDWCTTLENRDYEGRARRLLLATRSKSIAKEFWTGTIDAAEGLDSTPLASASTLVTSSAVAAGKALAKVDAAIADNLANGEGSVHCSVEVFNRLVYDGNLRRDGSVYVTPMGSRVISDAGYSGLRTGVATKQWIIGTSQVEYTLGPLEAFDLSTTEGMQMAVDDSINDLTAWAYQEAIVMYQPQLCLVAAEVDLS